jgi:hypothetical protein
MIEILSWFIGMPGFLWNFVVALGWWWVVITFVFWIMYVVFQVARRHYEKDTGWQKYVWGAAGVFFLLCGGLTDITYNATLAWVAFKDPPKEWTLTQRLGRYLTMKDAGATWFGIRRYSIANWICTKLLDPWQDGGHCRRAA